MFLSDCVRCRVNTMCVSVAWSRPSATRRTSNVCGERAHKSPQTCARDSAYTHAFGSAFQPAGAIYKCTRHRLAQVIVTVEAFRCGGIRASFSSVYSACEISNTSKKATTKHIHTRTHLITGIYIYIERTTWVCVCRCVCRRVCKVCAVFTYIDIEYGIHCKVIYLAAIMKLALVFLMVGWYHSESWNWHFWHAQTASQCRMCVYACVDGCILWWFLYKQTSHTALTIEAELENVYTFE